MKSWWSESSEELRAVQLREGLRPADREAIERIVRAAGVFRADEIAVALELVDIGLSVDDRGYRFVIAEAPEGRIAGYACFGAAPMTDGVHDLYWIVVDPAVQGRGVGTRLLGAVEERVARAGGRMLLVETEGSAAYDATRRFYQRAGYRELARICDYYRIGADKVIYGRAVRPAAEEGGR
jgi:ribosomal protein S18 acetylase RimI-like enzyme